MPTAAGINFRVALDRDTLSLVETGSSEVTESIGFQSTLQAQNSFSNEMLTTAGIDFGVALDRDPLSLVDTGASEVSGTTFDVDPYMQNYNYFSDLLLEQQKSEDNFVEVMKPSI